jgi:DNA-binding CsgD family transcriptional regulator
VAPWPLIGRADELRHLRGLLVGAEPHDVVLAGPAGVGKTAIALECLQLAKHAGWATARVTATRCATALPLGALAPLLPAVADWARPTADDLPDLLRRSAHTLIDRSGGTRLVLLVDDAHLLDDASATLVHHLALNDRVSVLATVRSGVRAPDPVVGLWKDGLAERVELRGLGSHAIEELLANVLDGPVDPRAVKQLATRCRGNVLFLRELVVGLLHDGTLRQERGRWVLRGELRPSNRLAELVEAHLAGLSPSQRALLELISIGEPIGQAELRALGDPADADVLEHDDLISSTLDGHRLQVWLAHPVYGDVLRSRLSALREHAIARSLAEVVEASGARRSQDILRVANWRLVGGGGEPGLLLRGATIARWREDYPLAERLARAARNAGAGFDAALLAAELTSLQGRSAEAERELATLATEATDDAQRARVAIPRFYNSAGSSGQGDIAILDDAYASITDATWRDRVAARRLDVLFNTAGPRATVEAARPLLDRATGGTRAYICLRTAFSLARLGRIGAALDQGADGYTAHLSTNRPPEWHPWWHLVVRCEALLHAGRFAEAEALRAEQYELAMNGKSIDAQGMWGLYASRPVADRGYVRTAIRRAHEAIALFQQLERPRNMRGGHQHLSLALALAGRGEEAADALATLDSLGLPLMLYDEAELIHVRGWVAAACGDHNSAFRFFEDAATFAADIGDLVTEAAALHSVARIGRPKVVAARLAAVVPQIEGRLAPARARHVTALAADDAADLELVSLEFEHMGAVLLAAEAAADAAVVRRRSGESREAAAMERRAAILAERAEDPITPALRALDVRARLTPAERDAALLAAAGHSNKDIARILALSVRTVENRLQRVYEKLGVSGRRELAIALAADI